MKIPRAVKMSRLDSGITDFTGIMDFAGITYSIALILGFEGGGIRRLPAQECLGVAL